MKKITILSTPAGGGHRSVSNALQSYLKNEYVIHDTCIFSDILSDIDVVKMLSFSKSNYEKTYNFCMQHKWFLICNILYKIGRWYFKVRNKKIQKLLKLYLIKEKTDLVISVVPLINNALIFVSQELNIPCLIIPTDLDAQAFIFNINQPKYTNLCITCAFDDKDILHMLVRAGFMLNQITITGFPVRSDFFDEKNIINIKNDFNIPHEKPVVMLLMGAMGSKNLINFAQQLAHITIPVHLLICIGEMKKIKEKIESITFPPHTTTSIISFTSGISDLMAISDILISKSGTVSVCEAIYAQVPILLDATSTVLVWEQFNHRFIKKHGLGDVIRNYNQVAPRISQLLSDKSELNQIKENIKKFNKKRPDVEIRHLIKKLIQTQ